MKTIADLKITDVAPPINAFIEIRSQCGWGTLSLEAAMQTLNAGIVNVTLEHGDEIVGFGRIIGDGVIYFYVQDLVVREPYRGNGLGALMIKRLIQKVQKIASPGASLGLMSAIKMEPFYEKHGFIRRPDVNFGAGMIKLLNTEEL